MRHSFRPHPLCWVTLVALSAPPCLALAACQGPGPQAVSPEQAGASSPVTGSGRIRGVVSESGIDYAVQQSGDKVVGDAEVYLDNLPSLRARSGPDGSFELAGVPVGEHFIVAEKKTDRGLLKVRTRAILTAPEQIADLKSLVMRRTGSITGQVRLEGGAEGLLGTDVFVAGSTLIAKAKDNGAFALANVAEGTYQLTASKAGYAPLTLEVQVKAGRIATMDFDLKKADPAAKIATIQGTVTADGRPIAGASVSLRGPGNFSTLSDEAGAFYLANVPDGDYLLHVYRPGYKLKAQPQKVAVDPADEKTRTLVLGAIGLERDGTEAPTGPPETPDTPDLPAPASSGTPPPAATPADPAAPTGLQVPGTRDLEIPFPGGTPRTTAFGVTAVGAQTYNVAYGQGFTPSRSGKLTAIAASLSAGDKATGADTRVSIFQADAQGLPTGTPLAAVSIPGTRIQKFGVNNLFTPVVFGTPIPLQAGQSYLAVFACERGENALLLSNQAAGHSALKISFAEVGNEHWLWDQIPDNEGFNYAVFRTYME